MDTKRRVKRGVQDALHRAGLDVRRAMPGEPGAYQRETSERYGTIDFPQAWQDTIDATKAYTMCSPEKMGGLFQAIEYTVRNGIPGAFVECGVWRGGSSMAAAMTFERLGEPRDIYLFDTFEGMPPAGEEDVDLFGQSHADAWEVTADREERATRGGQDLASVRAALLSTGLPEERLHTVKGMVEDTLPGEAPEQIGLLRLDTDWYESTRVELERLYPRLSPGGVLIIDDYGHFEGAKKAVDEYFGDKVFLHRLDYSGRLVVKPAA